MELTPEQRALLTFHLVPGIGPRLMDAIVSRFGSAEEALAAPLSAFQEIPYLKGAVAESLRKSLAHRDIDEELALIEKHQVRLLFHGDESYPAALATVPGPPKILFLRGSILAQDERAVAIVGSRACTSYGRRVAERMGYDLAKAGWTVVSGLARGIDGEAHKGALKAGGRTLAVLAGGLAKIYPPEHADLAKEVEQVGGLVSETAMRMEPMPGMFPARNRIISGLSRGVIVVEAAEKSGALITVRHATDQGREIFAVPGPVDNLASTGPLRMIRDGARLVRNAADVLEDLVGLAAQQNSGKRADHAASPPSDLEGLGLKVWETLTSTLTFDELVRSAEAPAEELAGLLVTLELRGVVRRLPGNQFERK